MLDFHGTGSVRNPATKTGKKKVLTDTVFKPTSKYS